jgi:hypothetical protein
MNDPVFWLGLSVGLVAAGLFAILVSMVPAVVELTAAARSVKRFFDTLQRDLPPTLEALRMTGLDVSDIADSVDEGIKDAGRIVRRVDRGMVEARVQARNANIATRSMIAGIRAGWQTFRSEQGLSQPPSLPGAPPPRPPLPSQRDR